MSFACIFAVVAVCATNSIFGSVIPASYGGHAVEHVEHVEHIEPAVVHETVRSTEYIEPVVPAYEHHAIVEPAYHVAEVVEPVPKPAPIYLRAPSPVPIAHSSYAVPNEPFPFTYYNGHRFNGYAGGYPYAAGHLGGYGAYGNYGGYGGYAAPYGTYAGPYGSYGGPNGAASVALPYPHKNAAKKGKSA